MPHVQGTDRPRGHEVRHRTGAYHNRLGDQRRRDGDDNFGHNFSAQARREKEAQRALEPKVMSRSFGPLTTDELLARIKDPWGRFIARCMEKADAQANKAAA